MNRDEIIKIKDEAQNHLINELLPFWTSRMVDEKNGGFITHFDKDGKDTGEDEEITHRPNEVPVHSCLGSPCWLRRR